GDRTCRRNDAARASRDPHRTEPRRVPDSAFESIPATFVRRRALDRLLGLEARPRLGFGPWSTVATSLLIAHGGSLALPRPLRLSSSRGDREDRRAGRDADPAPRSWRPQAATGVG